MGQEERLREAVLFFADRGYRRLLQGLADKYRSLGRLGGSVWINGLTDVEREAIGLLLSKDLTGRKSVTVTYAQFSKAIEGSKFQGVDVLAMLQQVLDKPLIPKREERARFYSAWDNMMDELHAGCLKHGNEAGARWIRHLAERGAGTRHLVRWFDSDPERLRQALDVVLRAIAELPMDAYERLPIYAARVTRDPHAFDREREEGKLLMQALVFLKQEKDAAYQPELPLHAEEATELLYEYRILRDDILNFVTCTGIVAVRGENRVTWWEQAARDRAVLHIPLRELVLADRFVVYDDLNRLEGAVSRKVYIVENSGVFSDLLDRSQRMGRSVPLICTGGQLHIAAWHLLDKLAEEGYEFYYSGDFDPEGLLMAQRLRRRYPNHLKLWRYSIADYERCLSDVSLSDSRFKQLQSINDPQLIPVKERMLQQRKVGYQEQLIEDLVNDIQGHR